MGKIYVKATPVSPFSAVQTYSWASKTPLIGTYDIGAVWTDFPGVANTGSGVTNNVLNPQANPTVTLGSTTILPNPFYQPTLGEIVQAYEPSLGWGEFILLRVNNLAVPVGTLVQWDCQYTVTAVPVKGTSQKSSVPVAVGVSTCGVTSGNPTVLTDGSGMAANSTNAMFAWFQIGGRAWTLKTNVQITPNSAVYISGTAGRVYATASAGGAVLGARAAPGTTTTTQSSVLVWYNRCAIEGT